MRSPSASKAENSLKAPLSIYPLELCSLLNKQGYHWVGRHSAVKKCRWLHESLVHDRPCYKQKFYGVESHRCLQMSPAVLSCLTRCAYCWRVWPEDVGYNWDEAFHGSWDDPETLVEKLILEHRRILSGYNSQVLSGRVEARKYQEALNPNQVAISLSGEPTLYPELAKMIKIFKKKGFTVYLVTSGVLPLTLRRIREQNAEPTQLYVSITSPDYETYLKVNRPIKSDLWKSLHMTLEEVEHFSCNTTMRITVIDGINMNENAIQHFAEMIHGSNFDYVEVKAYMHVGFSASRLARSHMPSFEDVQEFSKRLASLTAYEVKDNDFNSRVMLLSKR